MKNINYSSLGYEGPFDLERHNTYEGLTDEQNFHIEGEAFEDEDPDQDSNEFQLSEDDRSLGLLTSSEFEVQPHRDPQLFSFAERIMQESEMMQFEVKSSKTRCFNTEDIERVRIAYQDNANARAISNSHNCSCIVMLNVALGALLKLNTKNHPARTGSARTVKMARLTTYSIEMAMAQLRKAGFALKPILFRFLDARGRPASSLKPDRLEKSISSAIIAHSNASGCWYAYGLSILDGYHSVLLLVDATTESKQIFWLDQFSPDISVNVTSTLDQEITSRTQQWWQGVMDKRKVSYNSIVRIWPLQKLKK